ncbi:MAG: GTP cyclohydrolase II [Myxococcota bacterium]
MICPSKVTPSPGREVVRYAETVLPTRHGQATLIVYREVVDGVPSPQKEHVALVFGEPKDLVEDVHCRVHSECITSEVFGSLKCDCREQLHHALGHLSEEQHGVLLYLRQEGRGIGLGNKIRAYALQNQGADTIEANHQLGFETDLRTYDVAAGMLHDLGIRSVKLLTNNPEKISGLEEYGIVVSERLPVEIAPNSHSEDYLAVKREKCGHLLSLFE